MSLNQVGALSLKKNLMPTVDSWCGTVNFFRLYGAQTKFLIPGDIWREDVECFIRLQPMLTPSLTPMKAKVRHFVVPLRLVEPELAELIITGSRDGVLAEDTIPQFPSIFENVILDEDLEFTVHKDSILHVVFGVPAKKYDDSIIDSASAPRLYWLKAYLRIWWDYYRDENVPVVLKTISNGDYIEEYDDFDTLFEWVSQNCHNLRCLPVCLPKDYFGGVLPWQLKGQQPVLNIGNDFTTLHWKGITEENLPNSQTVAGFYAGADNTFRNAHEGLSTINANGGLGSNINASVQTFLDNIDVELQNLTINADDLRDMLAQTRILERLARTGSRYTEYLRANFGTSPADGTLQRAVYLGGFKQDILTTEVLQTGVGDTPVGTMRGHGISNAKNRMRPYVCKEFSLFFTTFEVEPQIQYTQGVSRELTYKSRFEFFNPSFQHLSEQEVRNGEVYFASDGENDETFGFRGIYDEFRTGKRRYFGEMLNSMAQWNQAITFSERPEFNGAFIDGTSYSSDFLRPFGLLSEDDGNPVIVDLYCRNTPLRPIIKEAIPMI